uniref:Uncharacterized protein n=1 Tax=Anguilla anguilla TaxID=7936 RepID=A0A0E9VFD0_ANGAN
MWRSRFCIFVVYLVMSIVQSRTPLKMSQLLLA